MAGTQDDVVAIGCFLPAPSLQETIEAKIQEELTYPNTGPEGVWIIETFE